jgi:hypothetical protein
MYSLRILRCWFLIEQQVLRSFVRLERRGIKRCDDSWEEVGAAANFRCPREEERNT